jgi:nitroreductase
MDTLECIRTRRSIRKFTADLVEEKDLQQILEAVRFAPSWANTQCVEVVVVREMQQKMALQDTVSPGNPARAGILQAPVVIALCARRGKAGFFKGRATTAHGDWFMFDAGIAAQNLCLAAHALGYGSVHVGLIDHLAAARLLSLPEELAVIELIPIGRPAESPRMPPRRDLAEWIHIEHHS